MDAIVTDTKKAKGAHLWERDPYDFYVEPPIATEALLKVERFVGPVWDPACGQGNICMAVRQAGYSAMGTDIVQRVDTFATSWFKYQLDFLDGDVGPLAPNIICNPPFYRAKGTEAFIRKALELATGKVCIFAPIGFLAGIGRAEGLFHDHPPARAWIIVPRVSCPPGAYLAAGNEAKGGTEDWLWLVWSLTEPKTRTEIRWLRPEGEAA